MTQQQVTVRPGKPGLVYSRDGRVWVVLSPSQLRLLLAIRDRGGSLPIREASRVIWPDRDGALTASQRASAARSVSRLYRRRYVAQERVRDAPLTLTEYGRNLLLTRAELIAEILTTGEDGPPPDA